MMVIRTKLREECLTIFDKLFPELRDLPEDEKIDWLPDKVFNQIYEVRYPVGEHTVVVSDKENANTRWAIQDMFFTVLRKDED